MARQTWNFDSAHSEVGFKVRHMMFSKVSGLFEEWSGDFEFDPDNPADTKVTADIDTASINTRNDDRDGHLRSGDFFDAENHPSIHFESKSTEKIDPATLKIFGDLTIRGTTKPVELDVEYHGKAVDPWGNDRIGFTATTTINRKDFGLTWNQALEAGGVLVGEKVEVELQIQATPAE